VTGSFERGAPVAILNTEGHKIGQGLCSYTSVEAAAIKGQKSDRIEPILGYPGRAALIHRDDMVL
jgi:glutamate 5-kinase